VLQLTKKHGRLRLADKDADVEDTVSDDERRPPFLILGVDVGEVDPIVDEKLDDVVRASQGAAMERRIAVVIYGSLTASSASSLVPGLSPTL
jgi:hypothetical protein